MQGSDLLKCFIMIIQPFPFLLTHVKQAKHQLNLACDCLTYLILQNGIGAVTDGGTGNVVFQAGSDGIIRMALGTQPQFPGELLQLTNIQLCNRSTSQSIAPGAHVLEVAARSHALLSSIDRKVFEALVMPFQFLVMTCTC